MIKFIKVFYVPVEGWNSKACQFHAAHAILAVLIKEMVPPPRYQGSYMSF